MLVKLVLMTCLIVSMTSCYPLHASCNLQWYFPVTSCRVVGEALVKQINRWEGDDCKGSGEKCLYELKSSSPTRISATHTTPKKKYVDTLEMNLAPSFESVASPRVLTFEKQSTGGCRVMARSRSNTWYAILDYGTNYCNLHNLVVGSGLSGVTGFKEETNNSQCTEYTSADCDAY